MAFKLGNTTVIHDSDAGAAIESTSNLDILKINGTDVLVHDGSTITLKNVDIQDAMESSINSDNITEGSTNKFYATSLFNTDFATKSTTDLTEGTNLYYTDARVDAYVNASMDTDDLTEGSTNLYYTDARVSALLGGGGGTTYATQTYVDTAVANLVDTAPATLDTLNELAAALGDDPNFATTVTNQIAALTHDGFADYVANEHIDWTSASAGTIHASNYTNTGDTTYTAGEGLQLSGTEFSMDGDYAGDFDVDGNITATGDVTAYSDERLKRNIETISNPIDLVNCLRGVNFEKDGRHSTGVIAQEVEEFLPEVVHTDSEGMKSVAYGNIAGLLIEAIKEQQQTIEELQKQIQDLQNKE